MNFAHEQAASWRGGEQAIALGEEVGEISGLAQLDGAGGPVAHLDLGGAVTWQPASAAIVDLSVGRQRSQHGCGEVRQVEEEAGAKDGQEAASVQREEEDAPLAGAAGSDIGTEVELRELRVPGTQTVRCATARTRTRSIQKGTTPSQACPS